jgi:hypothetical protein
LKQGDKLNRKSARVFQFWNTWVKRLQLSATFFGYRLIFRIFRPIVIYNIRIGFPIRFP